MIWEKDRLRKRLRLWLTAALLCVILFTTACNLGFFSFDSNAPFMGMGLATKLTIVGESETELGVCTTFAVRTHGNNDDVQPVSKDTKITLSAATPSGGQIFYKSAAECEGGFNNTTNYTSVLKGESYREFWVRTRDYTTGQTNRVTFTAASETLGQASMTIDVLRSAPQKIAFMAVPTQVDGGFCTTSQFTVQLRDGLDQAFSNPNTNITLSSQNGTFYRDSNCTSAFVDDRLATTRQFYYRSMKTGPDTITITANSQPQIKPISYSVTVNQKAYDFLITGPSDQVILNDCSPAYTVHVRDSNPTPNDYAGHGGIDANLVIANVSSGYFYETDTNCRANLNPVSKVNISATHSTANFYFKPTSSVNPNSQLKAENLSPPKVIAGTPYFTVNVNRHPTQLEFTQEIGSVNGGSCSGQFEVTLRDEAGGEYSGSGLEATLTKSSSTGVLYRDVNCQNALTSADRTFSGSRITFYYKDTEPATNVTITVSIPGQTPSISSDTSTFNVNSVPITLSLVAASADNPILGKCSEYTVKTLDSSDDPSGNVSVTVLESSSPSKGRLFSNSTDCSNDTPTTISPQSITLSVPGTASVWFRPVASGTRALRATASGFTDFDLTSINVVRRVTKLELTKPSGLTQISRGTCSPKNSYGTAFGAVLKDGIGVAYASVPQDVSVTLSSSLSGVHFYSSSSRCQSELTGNVLTISASTSSAGFFVLADNAGADVGIVGTTPAITNHIPNALSSDSLSFPVVADSLGLDTDFNLTGSKPFNIHGTAADTANAMTFLSDGGLLMAGRSTDSSDRVGLVKIDTNGNADTTFDGASGTGDGENGVLFVAIPNTTNSYANAVIGLSGSAFAVAGRADNQMFVARFTSTGAIDTSFNNPSSNSKGAYTIPLSDFRNEDGTVFTANEAEAASFVKLSGGDYFLAGTVRDSDGNYDVALANVKPDGTGTTFARRVMLKASLSLSTTRENRVTAAALYSSSILVAGSYKDWNNDVHGWVARFSSSGAYDVGFSGDGFHDFVTATDEGVVQTLMLTRDNNYIFLGGYKGTDFRLWKLTASGGSPAAVSYSATSAIERVFSLAPEYDASNNLVSITAVGQSGTNFAALKANSSLTQLVAPRSDYGAAGIAYGAVVSGTRIYVVGGGTDFTVLRLLP